jgi:hypothetical protein
MDNYSQDSAHTTNGLTADIFKTLTHEDKATHQRWARTMLGFYGTLLLVGGIVILAGHPGAGPDRQIAQASTPQVAP